MMLVRAMNESDLSEVYRIETLSFRTPWSMRSLLAELKNGHARYLVALVDGRIVGYCGMWVLFEESHITNIAIDPAFRGRGYGKTLLYAAMQVASGLGAEAMTLEVRETNYVAQDLYRKFDFEQQGFRKRYYSDTGEGAKLLWNRCLQRTVEKNACMQDGFVLEYGRFEEKRGIEQ